MLSAGRIFAKIRRLPADNDFAGRRACLGLALAILCYGNVSERCAAQNDNTFQPQVPHMDIVPPPNKPTLKLEGRAEVLHQNANNLDAWFAAQAYRKGTNALTASNFHAAADFFKQAGDGYEAAIGESKLLAESRFAEGQARRLLRQNAQAAKLFAMAAALFAKYDPGNPYLKAAINYLHTAPLSGKVTAGSVQLRPLTPVMAVDRSVPLKGKVTQFDDGTKLSALKDNEFFTGGAKRFLAEAATVDLSDAFVKKQVLKAFAKMNCLEFAALGGNSYTAPENYHALRSGGKTVIIGASDEFWTPVLHLSINSHAYGVSMGLPGMSKSSRNVMVLTDGQHVIAIDPRTNDTWFLKVTFARRGPDFTWLKLAHSRKGIFDAEGHRL